MWLFFAACVALFLILRCRWIGHLLVWDEAMALCTARAFNGGIDDPFSAWFWRHPPLHTLSLLGLAPTHAGFAERAEVFSIVICVLNQVLLFLLNRRVFGKVIALWSAFVIALLPGSTFFDVWIKQDHLVVTFGLLALLSFVSGRIFVSGLCLGFALLSKGTAGFFCLAAFLLWLGGARGKRTVKDLLMLVGVSAMTCGWWFLGVLPRVKAPGAGDTFQFALNAQGIWRGDWSFYFAQLPAVLGWIGVSLALTGLVFVLFLRHDSEQQLPRVWRVWPVALLVPAFVLLIIVPNKVPWIIIALLPAWATLAAVALANLTTFLSHAAGDGHRWIRPAIITSAAALVLVAVVPTRSFASIAEKLVASQWRGASNSKEAADVVNRSVSNGDRVLLTSFYYWKGLPAGLPDPIFTYYLSKQPTVLIRSHQLKFDQFVGDIRQYRLDWALLSPEPADASSVFGGFEKQFGIEPQKTTGAWLYRTTKIYELPSTNALSAAR